MKKRLLLALAMLMLCIGADAQNDELLSKLEEYLAAVEDLEEQEARAEVDFIISSVQQDSLRNRVAVEAYNHFRNSKIMGSENLAVYIYDNWFANFHAVFDTLEEFEDAEFYAFLNRKSLLGRKAEPLVMTDIKGREVKLPANDGKTLSIVYFYSASCPKCLYISHRMKELLDKKNIKKIYGSRKGLKINVYAVYTGDDQAEWQQYVKQNLNIATNSNTKLYHLEGEDVDYVTTYAVIQTPRLFLVDGDGSITGRNLDAAALEILLRRE